MREAVDNEAMAGLRAFNERARNNPWFGRFRFGSVLKALEPYKARGGDNEIESLSATNLEVVSTALSFASSLRIGGTEHSVAAARIAEKALEKAGPDDYAVRIRAGITLVRAAHQLGHEERTRDYAQKLWQTALKIPDSDPGLIEQVVAVLDSVKKIENYKSQALREKARHIRNPILEPLEN